MWSVQCAAVTNRGMQQRVVKRTKLNQLELTNELCVYQTSITNNVKCNVEP